MPSIPPTVFITGATGSQGGAVAKQLRELNWNVHALVRNTESAPSIDLAQSGVSLYQGDWDSKDALSAGLAGCNKLFLCLMPTPDDPDRERRQAERIISLARTAGIEQVVVTTSLGVSIYETADPRLQAGSLLYVLLEAKKGVERVVAAGGFEQGYTVLRPAFFMANFLKPNINNFADIVGEEASWTSVLQPETRLGLIDHHDIAACAVAAFQQPELYRDRAVGLVSEFLTAQEAMDDLCAAMGRPLKALFLTDEEIAELDSMTVLTKLDTSMRYMEDYVQLGELGKVIPLTRFKTFLGREKGKVKTFHPSV